MKYCIVFVSIYQNTTFTHYLQQCVHVHALSEQTFSEQAKNCFFQLLLKCLDMFVQQTKEIFNGYYCAINNPP